LVNRKQHVIALQNFRRLRLRLLTCSSRVLSENRFWNVTQCSGVVLCLDDPNDNKVDVVVGGAEAIVVAFVAAPVTLDIHRLWLLSPPGVDTDQQEPRLLKLDDPPPPPTTTTPSPPPPPIV
jgi:hypothetical protein